MLISVVMPAYNRERFLAAAIESVIAQTCRDWELMIVDDGSTDGTAAIAREFAWQHPERIRVLSQQNCGVTVARNAAIRAARGTHFAFLDSDDLWPPTKLEEQAALCATRPELAFAYTGYLLIDEAGRPVREVKPDPRFQGRIEELLWLEDNEIVGATLMIGREALFKVGLFNQRLTGSENLDLRLKLARLGPVAYLDAPLYKYRRHDDSLTAQGQLMSEQFLRLVDAHFDAPGATTRSPTLRAQVMSRHWQREGDRAFSTDPVGAIGLYLRALPHSRRKRDLVHKLARCVVGRRPDQLWHHLKRCMAPLQP